MTQGGLTETLKSIEDGAKGDEVSFGEVVEAVEKRGFGPLLVAPALIALLPTGAIPGVPFLCAVIIMLIAAQIALGRKVPWIPQRLKDMAISRTKYQSAVKKAAPYTKKIDSFFHERLAFLTRDIAQRIIAIFCVFVAFSIIPLGFIPFAAALPSATILIFGLSLSVHDGLLAALGVAFMSATTTFALAQWA